MRKLTRSKNRAASSPSLETSRSLARSFRMEAKNDLMSGRPVRESSPACRGVPFSSFCRPPPRMCPLPSDFA